VTRHKWGDDVVYQYSTVQECDRCSLLKVRRHEPSVAFPWVEFWREGDRVESAATPPCIAADGVAGTAPQHEIAATACRPEASP
jgi:hypothetical protein